LGDLFAHQDDIRIAGELLVEAFAEGFTVGDDAGHDVRKRVKMKGDDGGSVVEEMAADF
jgi:hypothetical protein